MNTKTDGAHKINTGVEWDADLGAEYDHAIAGDIMNGLQFWASAPTWMLVAAGKPSVSTPPSRSASAYKND